MHRTAREFHNRPTQGFFDTQIGLGVNNLRRQEKFGAVVLFNKPIFGFDQSREVPLERVQVVLEIRGFVFVDSNVMHNGVAFELKHGKAGR
jgi:hypothetical protein